MLRDAAMGKGNFGIGEGTAAQADAMGEAWVGPGYRVASDGKTLISEDGLRQYRPPSWKPSRSQTQANFESRNIPEGEWQNNGHLDISDAPSPEPVTEVPESPLPESPLPESPLPDVPPEIPCFLTTATVHALGMSDTCEPLELARYLRDSKMTSSADRAAVRLYYRVAPTIVSRSTDGEWVRFWTRHMRRITALIKLGEHDLAKDLYTFATAQLIDQKATQYADVELVDEVYDYGLKGFARKWIPYPIRFAMLKVAFRVGLAYQAVRLGLANWKFKHLLDL